MNKLLLVLGVSGVGKSSIIKELLVLDSRFIYIVPFTTRPSRGKEDTKISISDEVMDDLWSRGELLSVNEIYGIRCGTPRSLITKVLEEGNVPVLDWPLACLEVMTTAFPNHLYVVSVLPPSIEILEQRLMIDGRNNHEGRSRNTHRELANYKSSEFKRLCDLEIVSEENKLSEIAQSIYAGYLSSL